jgi:hypothetical protein
MKCFIFLLGAGMALAQPATSPQPKATRSSPNAQGVSEEWDVRTMLQNLKSRAQRLKPVLDQIQPETWVAAGGSGEYVAQWKTAETELGYLLQLTDSLAKQPDRLPLALDTYFRIDSMNLMLGSLIEGIRKYQNPAVAELVQGIMNENGGDRDRLREYVRDLATEKEQEFKIADQEAQRCRGALMRESPTGTRKNN